MPIPAITIVGNLTADPELRFTNTGKPFLNLTVAANDRYQDKTTGEWKDGDTTFVRGTIWGPLAEQVNSSVHKGTKVIVTGRLKQHNYETKDGEKRSSLELDVQDIGTVIRPAKQQSGIDAWATPGVKNNDSWPTVQPPTGDNEIPF